MQDKPHEKHANLARPQTGDFARNELAIIGITCAQIRELAGHLVSRLSEDFYLAYVDTDHHPTTYSEDDLLHDGACLQLTDKISFRQITFAEQPNVFEQRGLFAPADLVLVNGNHHTANSQILVIDPKKPWQKKLEKLTDVKLILRLDDSPLPENMQYPDAGVPTLFIKDLDAVAGFIREFLRQRTPALNGLVLVGGKSSRMGHDKSAIAYHDQPQAAHLFGMLEPLCSSVYLSCNAGQHAHFAGNFPAIEDTFLGLGPMGGILSAMQKNPDLAWLTVACDLPFLSEQILEYLISQRDPKYMATAFLDPEGKFPEPLITIWEPKAYPVLLRFLAQGYSCPRKVLINSRVKLVTAPDAAALTNVNNPDEYAQAIQHIRETTYSPE